VTIVEPVDQGR